MTKHYSIENLKEIAQNDMEFMAVVAQTFLDEIPPDLKAMVEAIHNDNKELAYQFAHKMKPNLEMFGVNVLKEISAIESWSKTSKNQSAITEQVEHVSNTLNAVFGELQEDFSL